MNLDEKNKAVLELPYLEEVFEALRRGKHIFIGDGNIFYALKNNEVLFETLFEKLGFKLIRHTRDFYYFHDAANFTDLASKMTVFMFILVEHLADQGDVVEEVVMRREFAYKDLPHLVGERYQATMYEAGVKTPEELVGVIRTMERFGFTRRLNEETFGFLVPIYRFLDLCMTMAKQATDVETPADAAGDLDANSDELP